MIYFLCGLFFILSVVFFYISYRSLRLNKMYQDYFANSASELVIISQTIDEMLKRRLLLTEDPDVQILVKGLKLAQNVMLSYAELSQSNPETPEEPQN